MRKPPKIEPTSRDKLIFRALYESRFLTISHIAALFPFEGEKPKGSAQQRIYKLKQAGFLREQAHRKRSEPARIALTRRSFECLVSENLLAGYPLLRWESLSERLSIKPSMVDHETAVLDVRVAIERALQQAGLTLVEYSTWPRLFTFHLSPHPSPKDGSRDVYPLTPDSLIRFHDSAGTPFAYFVELDRSSEVRPRLVDKALAYKALLSDHQAALKARLGMTANESDRVPIAALFVFQSSAEGVGNSAATRNNFIERVAARTSIHKLIYAATIEDVLRDPLGKIWLRPREYRAALAGTMYDPATLPEQFHHPRRPERDRLIREDAQFVNPFGQ